MKGDGPALIRQLPSEDMGQPTTLLVRELARGRDNEGTGSHLVLQEQPVHRGHHVVSEACAGNIEHLGLGPDIHGLEEVGIV